MIVVDTNVMVRLVVGGADGTDAALLFERETEWAAPSILMSELRNDVRFRFRACARGFREDSRAGARTSGKPVHAGGVETGWPGIDDS